MVVLVGGDGPVVDRVLDPGLDDRHPWDVGRIGDQRRHDQLTAVDDLGAALRQEGRPGLRRGGVPRVARRAGGAERELVAVERPGCRVEPEHRRGRPPERDRGGREQRLVERAADDEREDVRSTVRVGMVRHHLEQRLEVVAGEIGVDDDEGALVVATPQLGHGRAQRVQPALGRAVVGDHHRGGGGERHLSGGHPEQLSGGRRRLGLLGRALDASRPSRSSPQGTAAIATTPGSGRRITPPRAGRRGRRRSVPDSRPRAPR